MTAANWSNKLLAASAILVLGLLSAGILGGHSIYTQSRTTQEALRASQARADTASQAQAAILIMGYAEEQLVSASDPGEQRTAAILAIQASSTLDESTQRLEQTLVGSQTVAELSRLLKKRFLHAVEGIFRGEPVV